MAFSVTDAGRRVLGRLLLADVGGSISGRLLGGDAGGAQSRAGCFVLMQGALDLGQAASC